MSFYRIYRYSYKDEEKCDKHVFVFRGRNLKEADRSRKGEREKLKGEVRMSESLSRTKRVVKELAYCNKFDYFCTFTFSPQKVDRFDLVRCRKLLSNLFHNYKVRFSEGFRYLVIPQYHENGAIHFHGILAGIRSEDLVCPDFVPFRDKFTGELRYIPNVNHYLDWPYYSEKFGWFSCSPIVDRAKCSSYITRYITRDLLKMPGSQRVYMASLGLKRAELVFDSDDFPMVGKDDFKNEFCRIQWHSREFLESDLGIIDASPDAVLGEDPSDVVPEYEQLRI